MKELHESFLFVIPTANMGGAERVMFNLVAYLLEKDKHIIVITMSQGWKANGWNELKKYPNFKWIVGKYSSEKSSIIPITLKLFYLDNKYKFNYVFSSHIHVNSFLSQLKRLGIFKNSYLISRESFATFETYNHSISILFKQIYRYLYGSQDLLICQTDLMKDSLIKNLGFKPVKRVEVIYNPVNLNFIESNITSTVKGKIITACGRFNEIKQFDLLVEAFYKFNKIHPEYKLVIIGDGKLRAELEAQINSLQISDKIELIGKVANPYRWFAKSEIGIITSKREGFPNVLLEMMASGTSKIVITPCTGGLNKIPELIVTEDTGLNSILEGLNKAAVLNDNFSSIFKEYISDNHSTDAFWGKILDHINQ